MPPDPGVVTSWRPGRLGGNGGQAPASPVPVSYMQGQHLHQLQRAHRRRD